MSTPTDDHALLAQGLAALDLPADLAEPLLAYRDELARWNQAYNLTAVRDAREMIPRHLLDSLSVLPHVRGDRLIDVGSGGGLPGMPLALANGELEVTLLDSNSKKTRFCQHFILHSQLDRIEVVNERAENYHPEQPFDTVVSRAFASLGDFIRVAGHLCADGGRMLAMKAILAEEELETIAAGWKAHSLPLDVPSLDEERCVVVIERV
jgi:16S rRNA (guanine527-N7)-methyltransferase